MREFVFFDPSDNVQFVRTDAESANWQVDELSLTCLFPYDPNRVIMRGMRIGFEDDTGVFQPFEVRKVKYYEPDHYQELTCEHIVISELTDIHTTEAELTNATPESALTTVLNNQPLNIQGAARWQKGNVSATATSSGDIGMGSVWQNIRTIEQNWNVYILPRVTFNSAGITGRYLDIVPAAGVWHGMRLSIEKNTDEIGVTVDDTEVKTALYGYGGTAYDYESKPLDVEREKVTLAGFNWVNPPSGCSKNTADAFIVDTNATALYGRNGKPRYGFYQNSDITDQATLANKTWEALQATNKPTVTIDCLVRDLYRMGYHDEPIRLHDTVFVEITTIQEAMTYNDILTLEIVKLAVDLLDPTATRPTIGTYIPNIVYIQRETARAATGGASGSISGRRGGQDNTESEWSEYRASIQANNYLISLHAEHVDHDDHVLQAAGLDIDAQGVITYATDYENQIGSIFQVHSDEISLVVSTEGDWGQPGYGHKVNAASIVAGINDDTGTGSSYVAITADRVSLDSSGILLGDMISIDGSSFVLDPDMTFQCDSITCATNLEVGSGLSQSGSLYAYQGTISYLSTDDFTYYVGSTGYDFQDLKIGTSNTVYAKVLTSNSQAATLPNAVASFGTVTESGGTVTIPVNMADGTTGTSITFNVAAMQYFIDSIAAAKLEGWNAACSKVNRINNTIYGPISGNYGGSGSMYTAHYSSSSHSHSGAWMKIDGDSTTYRSDVTKSLTSFTGNVQFNSGYDSYSASSFYWT